MHRSEVVDQIIDWYDRFARPLPWREPDTTPWGVMVSEFMLQQTPVARVLEPWLTWISRWPTPTALAASESGEAIRAWGRLGYPRRALRLHAAARTIVADHGGRVPDDPDVLATLPGVGPYTAAAIASFGFGRRAVVLDTNVRRVLVRWDEGIDPLPGSITATQRALAQRWLPDDPATASRWAVASMELGAQRCTARSPDCGRCPVRAGCAWDAAGRPPSIRRAGPQAYQGTDRQCRGVLLQALRGSGHLGEDDLLAAWPDTAQAARSLASLVADGLVQRTPLGYSL